MEPRTDLPDGHRFQTCQNRECLKTSKEAGHSGQMRTCSGCKRASYCSRSCQRADFKRHKPICNSNSAAEIQTQSFDDSIKNFSESLRKWMPRYRQWQLEVYLHAMGLKKNPQKYRTHGVVVTLDAYPTSWGSYVFTLSDAKAHTFEEILDMSYAAGQDREIRSTRDNVLSVKHRNGVPVFGALAIYVAKAVGSEHYIVNSTSMVVETSMLEDFPNSEGWKDSLDLALRVPSGIYDKNIPPAMFRWTQKHYPYLSFCCLHTLELANPENRHKIQDCVEIDMMVSPPDSKGRYLFTPLATKRTTWEDYYSRRKDYDSTNGELIYEKSKEKNQNTIHEGETGIACIVLISMRNEVALSVPMFFKHSKLDENKKDLQRWNDRYRFLQKTYF